ncbi:uncharacterized protein LOC117155688 isoform X1 [Bombus vancouverensis nearcticus]|uniref:Uncharacterized protein LOC117206795 n=2 Tax=Pyrobombus TaxID=144703 RepID=A0A6P8MHZ8_9HYME|nr:uncharacterized protein LOC117155688 [Bombus vancouverensis nearcticus]XP_033302325.1 uncharacterized protein LOC117206795 [Bombus bifarius]
MLAFVPIRPAKTSGSPSPWSSNGPRAPPEQTKLSIERGGSKMRITYVLFGLALLVAYVHSSPIVKREAESEDLNPLNEIYIVEADDDQAADGDRTDRDKRKVGVIKLGVSNGIINFVFGKLDSFIDAKTKALGTLDEANKVKNAAYGIDNKYSATSKFISDLVASKLKAASGSIGPVLNSAQTFVSSFKHGLAGATASKLQPLAALAGGLSSHSTPDSHGHNGDEGNGDSSNGLALIGNLLSKKISSLSQLSQNKDVGHSGLSEGSTGYGSYGHVSDGKPISVTTEDIPTFDRMRVSLDVPPSVFGSGFTLLTNVSKILSRMIMNSARRTQSTVELLKPIFNTVLFSGEKTH